MRICYSCGSTDIDGTTCYTCYNNSKSLKEFEEEDD
jgi:hypothetical protein